MPVDIQGKAWNKAKKEHITQAGIGVNLFNLNFGFNGFFNT